MSNARPAPRTPTARRPRRCRSIACATGLVLANLLAGSGGCTPAPTVTTPALPGGLMAAHASLAAPPATAVDVFLDDIPPGRRITAVVLIDPAGRSHAAEIMTPITRERARGGGLRPTIGIGVTGGTSSGIKPSISLGLHATGGTVDHSRALRARVPIPDPAAFLRTAARWRIGVDFIDVTGEARHLSFPVAPRQSRASNARNS